MIKKKLLILLTLISLKSQAQIPQNKEEKNLYQKQFIEGIKQKTLENYELAIKKFNSFFIAADGRIMHAKLIKSIS